MNDEIVHASQHEQPFALMPVMDIESAINRRDSIVKFVQGIMEEDRDFGKIPGTTKPTLLKPGAEKLTTFFGLSPRFLIQEKDLDWTGREHAGEAFFYFQYKCQLWRGDLLVGEGLGSCNSWEKKYRYRMADRVCPKCENATIIKGKEEYGGGWLCYRKKGGCGEKWPDGAGEIEGQEAGMVPNDNPADLVNTIDKMSQKRSLIAATLIAVNASEFFTQDMEDIVDGSFKDAEEKPAKKKDEPKKDPPIEHTPFTEPVGEKQWPPEKAEDLRYALITAKVLPPETHDKHVAMFLNLLPFGIEVPTKDVVGWAKMYRGYKDETNDTTKAVDMASKKWFTGKSE